MARHVRLGPKAQKNIENAVDLLFERLKIHFLGEGARRLFNKQISFNSQFSLTSLFNDAAKLEGVAPREEVIAPLLKIANAYLDASKEKTKAKVIQKVQAFLIDAQNKGIKTNVETVLGGQLSEVFAEAHKDVKRIFETEATTVRNTSIFDSIGRVGAMVGNDDPTVFFVTVNDNHQCAECTRLHLQPDGITPKVYKLSELGAGYHKKGEDTPKTCGLHPNCRCVLTHLVKSYGFNSSGRVTYVGADHDEYKTQRGVRG